MSYPPLLVHCILGGFPNFKINLLYYLPTYLQPCRNSLGSPGRSLNGILFLVFFSSSFQTLECERKKRNKFHFFPPSFSDILSLSLSLSLVLPRIPYVAFLKVPIPKHLPLFFLFPRRISSLFCSPPPLSLLPPNVGSQQPFLTLYLWPFPPFSLSLSFCVFLLKY